MAFEQEIVAAEAEVDALGHVSNVVYVRWIQDIASAHSASVGLDFDAYQRLGSIFVVRRHTIDYLAPVLGGDRLAVRTWVAEWRAASCERHTRITRIADGKEVTRGVTEWVLVGIEGGRPRRIPADLAERFGKNAVG